MIVLICDDLVQIHNFLISGLFEAGILVVSTADNLGR